MLTRLRKKYYVNVDTMSFEQNTTQYREVQTQVDVDNSIKVDSNKKN